jgi:hypothetical protein
MDCDLTYEILKHQVIFWKVALLFLLELYGIISTRIWVMWLHTWITI